MSFKPYRSGGERAAHSLVFLYLWCPLFDLLRNTELYYYLVSSYIHVCSHLQARVQRTISGINYRY